MKSAKHLLNLRTFQPRNQRQIILPSLCPCALLRAKPRVFPSQGYKKRQNANALCLKA